MRKVILLWAESEKRLLVKQNKTQGIVLTGRYRGSKLEDYFYYKELRLLGSGIHNRAIAGFPPT